MGAWAGIGGSGRAWIVAPVLAVLVAAAPAPSVVRIAVGAELKAFKIPQNSLVRGGVWKDQGPVRFPGKFRIAGRYSLEAGISDLDDKRRFMLVFIPSRQDAVRLPSPVMDQYGGVQDMFITNADEFIAKVVGPRLSQAVWTGQTKAVSGRVEMWVDSYAVDGSCDRAEYYIRFLSIVKEETPKFASAGESSACG